MTKRRPRRRRRRCLNPLCYFRTWSSFFVCATPGGVLPEKLGGDEKLGGGEPLPYLWAKSAIFATLVMTCRKIWYPIQTFVTGTAALNIGYEGFLLTVLLIMTKK